MRQNEGRTVGLYTKVTPEEKAVPAAKKRYPQKGQAGREYPRRC